MKIETVLIPVYCTNCYLAADEETGLCAIIDPGQDGDHILDVVREAGWTPACVLLTHAHYDHTRGIPEIRRQLPDLPVYVHDGDTGMSPPYFFIEEMGPLTRYGDGDTVEVGSLTFHVIHTPGHTAGSVVLRVENTLFTGDTLFHGSMGRTDLPGGSAADMTASLRRLAALEGDFTVLPGHMSPSTLAQERELNPYMKEAMKG